MDALRLTARPHSLGAFSLLVGSGVKVLFKNVAKVSTLTCIGEVL